MEGGKGKEWRVERTKDKRRLLVLFSYTVVDGWPHFLGRVVGRESVVSLSLDFCDDR